MLEQEVKNIIADIEEIEMHDVMYDAVNNKLTKSLQAYADDLSINSTKITDISSVLNNSDYFRVVKMIARRVNL